jgi:hypothetical protein
MYDNIWINIEAHLYSGFSGPMGKITLLSDRLGIYVPNSATTLHWCHVCHPRKLYSSIRKLDNEKRQREERLFSLVAERKMLTQRAGVTDWGHRTLDPRGYSDVELHTAQGNPRAYGLVVEGNIAMNSMGGSFWEYCPGCKHVLSRSEQMTVRLGVLGERR